MVPFLFAVHSHQPEGNFGWVFEKAFGDCYDPFLTLLAEFPELKCAIHYSGCLLEWIEEHKPAHVKLLKKLVKRGQVEILGGGFYEPILPAIPRRDAKAQLQRYSDHLEKLFGSRPQGIWLTERVWDPELPKLLAGQGVKYTLLDDSHFRYGGVPMEEVWGPFVTEREGQSLTLLPIDKTLRYLIPFREPDQIVAHIRERASRTPGFVACYGDDGEKFGLWPGTREWVHEKGWLRRFFQLLTTVKDEIATVHFSDYLKSAKPRGRVYLPPASYEEMMEWVLPPDLGERFEDYVAEVKSQGRWEPLAPFIRGGHWDMFLTKYEEANRMQKRMLLASERVNKRSSAPEEAKVALYKSQCNCAYWHGVFGGLYLGHLRHAVYSRLLEAEARAGVKKTLTIERRDYDCDGFEEVLIESPAINVFLDPARGGSICALEYPAKRFSLSNVMSRRREAYHRKLARAGSAGNGAPATIHELIVAKEPGLEKLLIHDRFPRHSLQEHLVAPEITLEQLEREEAVALGRFAGAAFQVLELTRDRVTMVRKDRLGDSPFRIEKTLNFDKGRAGFTAHYRLVPGGSAPLTFRLGIEFNLTLLAGDEPDRYFRLNGETPPEPLMVGRGRHDRVELLEAVNAAEGFTVVLQPSLPAAVFRFPIWAVSLSESGFEKSYQGTAIWLTWLLCLEPGQEWPLQIDFDLREI